MATKSQINGKQKILVVDNNPVICTLVDVLLREEFDVITSTNGSDAHDLVIKHDPDLILLDIMMPDANGYDVCLALKKDAQTARIPIIFLTAKDDDKDETKGFSVGAVDYIKKPFSPPIVRARVRAHLELKNQRDSLTLATDKFSYAAGIEEKEHQLKQAEKERLAKQSAMIHSGRLTAIGEMAACMAHEIGNPLNAISIILQKWEMRLNNNKLDTATIKKDLDELKGNVERIARLTSQVRTFGRAKENMTRIDAGNVVKEALSLCRMQHHNEKIKLEEDYKKDLPKVNVIPAELEQVVLNLLSNAFYSINTMSEKKGATPTVTISINSAADRVNIRISDNGGGVPEEQAKFIFDPFFTTKPSSKGTGLGLSISKDIMEKFHGGLILHNKPGVSATFEAWLPIEKEEKISQAS